MEANMAFASRKNSKSLIPSKPVYIQQQIKVRVTKERAR